MNFDLYKTNGMDSYLKYAYIEQRFVEISFFRDTYCYTTKNSRIY